MRDYGLKGIVMLLLNSLKKKRIDNVKMQNTKLLLHENVAV